MIPRCSRLTLFSICCAITILAIGAASPRADDPPAPVQTVTVTRTVVSTYRGHTARYYARWGKHRTRQLQASLRREHAIRNTLLARPSVSEAINLSAAVYGNGSWLWRVARCESTLQTDPPHNNPSRGLFQFRPDTFASTPFGSFSVFSPYASALAAGWMASQGRASEWVCR